MHPTLPDRPLVPLNLIRHDHDLLRTRRDQPPEHGIIHSRVVRRNPYSLPQCNPDSGIKLLVPWIHTVEGDGYLPRQLRLLQPPRNLLYPLCISELNRPLHGTPLVPDIIDPGYRIHHPLKPRPQIRKPRLREHRIHPLEPAPREVIIASGRQVRHQLAPAHLPPPLQLVEQRDVRQTRHPRPEQKLPLPSRTREQRLQQT